MENTTRAKKLADKKAELLAEIAKIEAKEKAAKAKDRARERKRIDNKKYLLGAMMLAKMAESEESRSVIMEEVDIYMTRDIDREAFGLPIPAPVRPVAPPLSEKQGV